MAQADPNSEAMKQVLKEALTETLHEQRELLREVFVEVVEQSFAEALGDVAFAKAIREGRQSERVERDEVFDVLDGRA